MRRLSFREALMAFSMLVVLSLLQVGLGINGVISFLIGALSVAVASFFGVKLNGKREIPP